MRIGQVTVEVERKVEVDWGYQFGTLNVNKTAGADSQGTRF